MLPRTMAVVAAIAAAACALARAGADGPADRLKALFEEKRRLERDNQTLSQELAIASTPAPYVFVDVERGSFEFRVRGKAHKVYKALEAGAFSGAGAPLPTSALRAAAGGPVEVIDKAGGPPELVPPPPGSGDEEDVPAGGGAAPGAGAEPARSDAGILGVDAPTEFDVTLDRGIRLEIRTVKEGAGWQRARRSLESLGRAISDGVSGLLGRERRQAPGSPAAVVRIAFDEATAKAFYHSLLPGERIYFVPEPPAPVALVASLGSASQPPPRPASGSAAPTRKPAAVPSR